MAALAARGVRSALVTLHVGAGTFQPLRSDELAAHVLHAERRLRRSRGLRGDRAHARARGGRVVAVGTTVVRALESAALAAGARAGDPGRRCGPGRARRACSSPRASASR